MDLDGDPLGSSKDAMRAIGYRTVDLLVDQLTDPDIPDAAGKRRGPPEALDGACIGRAAEDVVTLTCMGGPEHPFHGLVAEMDAEVRPFANAARPPGRPYDFHWHGLMGYNDTG